MLVLLLTHLSAWSSNVLIYNPDNGYTIAYLISVNTPAFEGITNALINPVIPAGIPLEFTKVSNNLVVALSSSESNAVISALAANNDSELRASANNGFVVLMANALVLRALASTIGDEINIIRNELSVAKTNISKFQSTPTLTPRTLVQFSNSISNKVNSGSVDTIP